MASMVWPLLKVARVSQHAFLSEPISPAAVVFDLGANNGEFCLEVAGTFGCTVFAAEPVPELAAKLAGRSDRVNVSQVAIGGETGRASITYDLGRDKSGSLLAEDVVRSTLGADPTRRTVEVHVESLAQFLSRAGDRVIDLLKVDIEGAELDAFDKAPAHLLQRCKQVTVEFHDFWYPELSSRTEVVKQRLQSLGFEMVRFTPNNKDVLFINGKLLPLSKIQLFVLRHLLRNVFGFGRMIRVYWYRWVRAGR